MERQITTAAPPAESGDGRGLGLGRPQAVGSPFARVARRIVIAALLVWSVASVIAYWPAAGRWLAHVDPNSGTSDALYVVALVVLGAAWAWLCGDVV